MKEKSKKSYRLKMQSKFILIYVVGGLFPIILVATILISGYGSSLIELAKDSEMTELSFVENNLLREYTTVSKVSEGLFFNEVLEKIAITQYDDVMEMRADYVDFYSSKDDYMRYYYDTICRINLYIDNDTIQNNAFFTRVDDTIRNEEWYRKTVEEGGKAIWRYGYNEYAKCDFLMLSRLIRTKKQEEVGVLNISIRNSRLLEIIGERDILTCLVLDNSILVSTNGAANQEEILRFCQDYAGQEGCFKVEYNGEECMLTISQVLFDEVANRTTLLSIQSYRNILSKPYQKTGEILLYVGISVVCAVTMITVFSLRYGNRINKFRIEMAKAAGGDFKIAEKVSGNDEIAELYDNLYVMVESIEELLNVVYQEKILKEQLNSRQKEVEFKMLANQINPHFLYNTLETIRMKARAAGSFEVEDLVKILSKIMRRNIEVSDSHVSLKSELQLVEYYLKIQQYRFENRIRFSIDVQCDIENYQILPLLIQPLVENAFVHGLEGRKGGGEIKVLIEKTDKMRIHVQDNGLGIKEEKLAEIHKSLEGATVLDSCHIGISNVNQRIKLRYGKEYGLIINSIQGKGTEVIIEIPIKEE